MSVDTVRCWDDYFKHYFPKEVSLFNRTDCAIQWKSDQYGCTLLAHVSTDDSAKALFGQLEKRGWHTADEEETPQIHFVIRISGPSIVIKLVHEEPNVGPCVFGVTIGLAFEHSNDHSNESRSHHTYAIPDLCALETPLNIEVFTDVFFGCPEFEAAGLWLFKREDVWRLKKVLPMPPMPPGMLLTDFCVDGEERILNLLSSVKSDVMPPGILLTAFCIVDDEERILDLLSSVKSDVKLDQLPPQERVLTVRVTDQSNTIVDLVRLTNGKFYAVQKRTLETYPLSSTTPPSKLFAFREPTKVHSLSIDDLPLPILFSLPISTKERTRSIMSRVVVLQRQSFYNTDPSRRLRRQIIEAFRRSGGDVSKIPSLVGLIPHCKYTKILLRNLLRQRRWRTVEQIVSRWVDALVRGHFCVRNRPQYGKRGVAGDKEVIHTSSTPLTVYINVENYGNDATEQDIDADTPELIPKLDESVVQLQVPPSNTRRFFHGTSTSKARNILDGQPGDGKSSNDLGEGFYMADKFEVSASYAIGENAFTTTSGEHDPCVLVLDLDLEAAEVKVLHLEGSDWGHVVKHHLRKNNLDSIPEIKARVYAESILSGYLVTNADKVADLTKSPASDPIPDEDKEYVFRPGTLSKFKLGTACCFVKQIQMVRWQLHEPDDENSNTTTTTTTTTTTNNNNNNNNNNSSSTNNNSITATNDNNSTASTNHNNSTTSATSTATQ